MYLEKMQKTNFKTEYFTSCENEHILILLCKYLHLHKEAFKAFFFI